MKKDNVASMIALLQKSVDLILRKPILLVPVISGTILLALLDSLMDVIAWNWIEDPFTGFWFENMSWVPLGVTVFSYLCLITGTVIYYLIYFISIYMAKDIKLNLEPNIKKSGDPMRAPNRIIPVIIVILVGQVLLLTGILIPIGLLVLIIAALDDDNVSSSLSKAVKFFRLNSLDMILLALAWFIPRAVLTAISLIPIPYAFQLSAITDLIVGVAIVDLYMSNNAGLPSSTKQPSIK